jgi:hypothetical protein
LLLCNHPELPENIIAKWIVEWCSIFGERPRH